MSPNNRQTLPSTPIEASSIQLNQRLEIGRIGKSFVFDAVLQQMERPPDWQEDADRCSHGQTKDLQRSGIAIAIWFKVFIFSDTVSIDF